MNSQTFLKSCFYIDLPAQNGYGVFFLCLHGRAHLASFNSWSCLNLSLFDECSEFDV